MADDASPHEASTRRDYMKYDGTMIGGGLLAGCTGTETVDGGEIEADDEGESYSESMSPAGKVRLEGPPERVFVNLVHHADMALALGHGESVNALYSPENFRTLYELFLGRLEGVSNEWADLPNSWKIETCKERGHQKVAAPLNIGAVVRAIDEEALLDAIDNETIREYAVELRSEAR